MQDNSNHHLFCESVVWAGKGWRANTTQWLSAITHPIVQTQERSDIWTPAWEWLDWIRGRKKNRQGPHQLQSQPVNESQLRNTPTPQLITVCYLTVVTSREKLAPQERGGHASQLCGVCQLRPNATVTLRCFNLFGWTCLEKVVKKKTTKKW